MDRRYEDLKNFILSDPDFCDEVLNICILNRFSKDALMSAINDYIDIRFTDMREVERQNARDEYLEGVS